MATACVLTSPAKEGKANRKSVWMAGLITVLALDWRTGPQLLLALGAGLGRGMLSPGHMGRQGRWLDEPGA